MKKVTVKQLIEGLTFYSQRVGGDAQATVASDEDSIYIVLPNEEIPLEIWEKMQGQRKDDGADEAMLEAVC